MERLLLIVFLLSGANSGNNFWTPINTFLDNVAKKTQEVQDFVSDQEDAFIENVTNGTKQVNRFLETQKKNVETSLKTYEDSIKHTNDEMMTYIKSTSARLEEDFKKYLSSQPKDLWQAFHKREDDLLSRPEEELSTPGMIAARGYTVESHTVLTEDQYILTVHRIPRGISVEETPTRTVLLQHGLFASSADWVFAGPERSLPYTLAEKGYDVWMGNVRGNKYSREHATLNTNSFAYWNFSWHEIAMRDLPAVIDYIRLIKGPETKINYIGHSMGTTLLFALLSSKPEYNDKLNSGIAMAPVVFMSGVSGPARMLAPYASNVGYAFSLLGGKEFAPREPGRGWLGSDACESSRLDINTCKKFVFMLCGDDEEQLDSDMLRVFLAHIGSGTSIKTVLHYAQEISSQNGRFQQFDYGPTTNEAVYGSATPPEYELAKVNVPVALISSRNDPLSNESDVSRLYEKLNITDKEFYSVSYEKFNHLDFLWAKDVRELLHKKIFELLERWNH